MLLRHRFDRSSQPRIYLDPNLRRSAVQNTHISRVRVLAHLHDIADFANRWVSSLQLVEWNWFIVRSSHSSHWCNIPHGYPVWLRNPLSFLLIAALRSYVDTAPTNLRTIKSTAARDTYSKWGGVVAGTRYRILQTRDIEVPRDLYLWRGH